MSEQMNAEVETTEAVVSEEVKTEVTPEETVQEPIPSMAEFEEQINRSFKKISEGDILKGTIVAVSDTEVSVDLRYYAEGIIPVEEVSNDPGFSMKEDLQPGDEVSVYVMNEDDGDGNILLSLKKANDILAWERLAELMEERKVITVKVAGVVNAGVIAYVEGIRGFIPASQLSLKYVEDVEKWLGKTLDVYVITVDEANKKLVLSGKEVEREREEADKNSKIARLQKGLVTNGIIEKIASYGCFVNIGEGLTGLVHISQICGKHIKSPNEVVKEGQEVSVKIMDVKDGKISLSMKAVEEKEEVIEEVETAPMEFKDEGGDAGTGLGALLSGFKFD